MDILKPALPPSPGYKEKECNLRCFENYNTIEQYKEDSISRVVGISQAAIARTIYFQDKNQKPYCC